MSSLSQVIVTRISGLTAHPNADNLLVGEFAGMPFLVNKNDTKEGDLRLIVPFDMQCPHEDWVPEFTRGKRVKPIKLRGVFSMCVCLPLPEGDFIEDEDVTEKLGFTKWEPPELRDDGIDLQSTGNGIECYGPQGLFLQKYDLESIRKYKSEYILGEQVYITAKLHGENFTCVWWDDQFWVKSRNRWIAEGDNKWWNSFRLYDFSFLKDYPGLCLVGEKYGNVPKFRYDCINGEQRIRFFDIYNARNGSFFTVDEFLDFKHRHKINIVPCLYRGPWCGLDAHKELVEGKSCLGGDIEEGFVCETVNQRSARGLSRVKTKYHSEKYLIYTGK